MTSSDQTIANQYLDITTEYAYQATRLNQKLQSDMQSLQKKGVQQIEQQLQEKSLQMSEADIESLFIELD